ncbi:hypothetical protein [uncultured Paludibaculum sp.]|uniref:hypothetical protein n=1 Tax=uncultured Paludibaculum sp. TaxID=1765020 RepID=UPI002AAB8F79|nr:hypothetical protein [uncultured Paludibaculum sp.]
MSEQNEDDVWRLNYFNYFTEVEEHFQQARGSSLFLLSSLDWAMVENWKNSGIPLAAVLRGIDAAFEKWRSRKQKTQLVNSLAYCTQAVMKEAEAMANNLPASSAPAEAEPPFPLETVKGHLRRCSDELRAVPGYAEIADAVAALLADVDLHFQHLEELDQRLTALEDKLSAVARTRLSDEELFRMRRELDLQLRPYRGKMTADQLVRLEKTYLDKKVYDHFRLPRLSLFYIT